MNFRHGNRWDEAQCIVSLLYFFHSQMVALPKWLKFWLLSIKRYATAISTFYLCMPFGFCFILTPVYYFEQCRGAALDELFGKPEECFQRYQTAQILLHSLSQQVHNEQDRMLLTKCKSFHYFNWTLLSKSKSFTSFYEMYIPIPDFPRFHLLFCMLYNGLLIKDYCCLHFGLVLKVDSIFMYLVIFLYHS